MRGSDSLVSLDPIAKTRKQQDSPISRLFKTRRYRGKGMSPAGDFGHYLFVGKQGGGKTSSALWYAELLKKRYVKKNKKVVVFSNMGIGRPVNKMNLHETLSRITYNKDIVYIFIIDEIQSYFPKDTKDKTNLYLIDCLTGDFSQLRKRQAFVLSTAQVYGRLNKNLREQCLYMVNCRKSKITNKCVCDFILGDDIMCDDLGRWSGIPQKICVHGLPKIKYDTHALILE